MNKYITRYCNNNKEYCTNLPPTRRRYSTIIVKILRPLKNFRNSKYQIHR